MYGDLDSIAPSFGTGSTTTASFHVALDFTNFASNWLVSHVGLLAMTRYGWCDLIRCLRAVDERFHIDSAVRHSIRRLSMVGLFAVITTVHSTYIPIVFFLNQVPLIVSASTSSLNSSV